MNTKKIIKLAAAAVLLLAVLGSCTTFKMSGVQITKELPPYNAVGEFEITVPVWELLGVSGGANLLNVSAEVMDAKIYDSIQREISKFSGDAAVNVEVAYKVGLVDAVINGITGTILAPAKAHVTGTIIKYSK